MKNLYIVRHAKSSWDYPELSDIDRPLNKRGKKNAPEMGQRLAAENISLDLDIILLVSGESKRSIIDTLLQKPETIPAGMALMDHTCAELWTELVV